MNDVGSTGNLVWTSAARTHTGLVRRINEDACLDLPNPGIWAVADGMGGHEAGDVASARIIENLRSVKPAQNLYGLVTQVVERLDSVNTSLRREADQRGLDVIGSTVVALVLFGHDAASIWAGDSRAYLLRDRRLSALTRDHSLVEDYVKQGLIDAGTTNLGIASNVITRAVGADDALNPDINTFTIAVGDRLLLCSDGLYREVSEPEIEKLLQDGDCASAADALMAIALERGARDNITLVIVDIAGV